MSTYEFEMKSKSPIIFHHDNIEANDTLKAWRDDSKNRSLFVPGDDRTPPWTWMTYLYDDGENIAIPSENLMAGLRQAGAQVTLRGSKTFKSATQSGMFIPEEYCRFEGPEGQVSMEDIEALHDLTFAEQAAAVDGLGFGLFMKRGKIGQAKHVRVRPRFESWTISGTIEVTNPAITADILKAIFSILGKEVGILDWRPSSPKSPGPFGRSEARLKKSA